jgi:hypothetical protein
MLDPPLHRSPPNSAQPSIVGASLTLEKVRTVPFLYLRRQPAVVPAAAARAPGARSRRVEFSGREPQPAARFVGLAGLGESERGRRGAILAEPCCGLRRLPPAGAPGARGRATSAGAAPRRCGQVGAVADARGTRCAGRGEETDLEPGRAMAARDFGGREQSHVLARDRRGRLLRARGEASQVVAWRAGARAAVARRLS